jgi:hypothetical protein
VNGTTVYSFNPLISTAIATPEATLRIRREGTAGVKQAAWMDVRVGTYANDIGGKTKVDLALTDGNVGTPDVNLLSLLSGGVILSPTGQLNVVGKTLLGGASTLTTTPAMTDSTGTNVQFLANGVLSSTAVATPETVARFTKAGTSGVKQSPSMDVQIGTHTADVRAYTRVDFQLKDQNVPTPDVTVLTMLSGGQVGIGTTSVASGQKLEVNGGVALVTATAKPSCSVTTRGTFWVAQGGAGVKDAVEVCAKDAADTYAWRTIY